MTKYDNDVSVALIRGINDGHAGVDSSEDYRMDCSGNPTRVRRAYLAGRAIAFAENGDEKVLLASLEECRP